MNVGIIRPIKYLDKFKSRLELCYASLLSNKVYLDYYSNSSEVLILDDSPALPRKPNLEKLKKFAQLLEPHYVIMPSIDFSADKTISYVTYFLKMFSVERPVGVLQGYDIESLGKCYKFLSDCCDMIALPSPLEKIAKRGEIARDLKIKEKILWLEVYRNPYEEVPIEKSVGICTSFPFRVAQVNKRVGEYAIRPVNPVVLNFNVDDLVDELIDNNVREYIEAVQG